jgi:hypothetical protein
MISPSASTSRSSLQENFEKEEISALSRIYENSHSNEDSETEAQPETKN